MIEIREISERVREVLDDRALARIGTFLQGRLDGVGGFCGRDGCVDLYYTLFGLDAAEIVGAEIDRRAAADYLAGFNDGESLDIVEFSCLVRCWERTGYPERAEALFRSVERFRGAGGAFLPRPGHDFPTIYANYLALQTACELGVELGGGSGVRRLLRDAALGDGSYGERSGLTSGTTTVTAAATVLNLAWGAPVPEATVGWLGERWHEAGGFRASPMTPLPDLLSTAAAELALVGTGDSSPDRARAMVGFVEDLWNGDGGFCGHIADEISDCEYTFYALVTLGLCAERLR